MASGNITEKRRECLQFFRKHPNETARGMGISGKTISDCFLAGWLTNNHPYHRRSEPLQDWGFWLTEAGEKVLNND